METLLKADIFFVIATVGVVLFTGCAIVLVYFSIRLVRSLNKIAELVHKEAELIKDDIDGARESIRANAEVVGTIIGAVARGGARATRKKNTKK